MLSGIRVLALSVMSGDFSGWSVQIMCISIMRQKRQRQLKTFVPSHHSAFLHPLPPPKAVEGEM